jgi:anthranilate 1,2-dioxygenase large subunit/terephthalate 1,2-dioxygenase oxygenase component alpha subunit
MSRSSEALRWPDAGVTRVPYWVYQDPAIYRRELERIYEGPTWNYLCLEADVPNAGDYYTTFMGEMPVVVTRDADGSLYAFENRCAHRGALICIDNSGNAGKGRHLTCVYHAWSYDLQGNLKGIAFRRGVNGKGGMPESACPEAHAPRKLKVATLCGLVFGSLKQDMPSIEDYIGPDVLPRIRRVLRKPLVILGRYTQQLPNNWKLYYENVKDSYHASLLHTFLTKFGLARFSQKGGLIVSRDGAHHVSYSMANTAVTAANDYKAQNLRVENEGLRLQAGNFLPGVDEVGDGITLQVLSVFPSFAVAHIYNCIAVRQIVPKGPGMTHLLWTFVGFPDDTPEMTRMRQRQCNLFGPAGLVAMEDGAVGGFVQRGTARALDEQSVVEMGGSGIESSDTRANEASVRGFWTAWRRYMDL